MIWCGCDWSWCGCCASSSSPKTPPYSPTNAESPTNLSDRPNATSHGRESSKHLSVSVNKHAQPPQSVYSKGPKKGAKQARRHSKVANAVVRDVQKRAQSPRLELTELVQKKPEKTGKDDISHVVRQLAETTLKEKQEKSKESASPKQITSPKQGGLLTLTQVESDFPSSFPQLACLTQATLLSSASHSAVQSQTVPAMATGLSVAIPERASVSSIHNITMEKTSTSLRKDQAELLFKSVIGSTARASASSEQSMSSSTATAFVAPTLFSDYQAGQEPTEAQILDAYSYLSKNLEDISPAATLAKQIAKAAKKLDISMLEIHEGADIKALVYFENATYLSITARGLLNSAFTTFPPKFAKVTELRLNLLTSMNQEGLLELMYSDLNDKRELRFPSLKTLYLGNAKKLCNLSIRDASKDENAFSEQTTNVLGDFFTHYPKLEKVENYYYTAPRPIRGQPVTCVPNEASMLKYKGKSVTRHHHTRSSSDTTKLQNMKTVASPNTQAARRRSCDVHQSAMGALMMIRGQHVSRRPSRAIEDPNAVPEGDESKSDE